MTDFKDKLKELRKEKGTTQKQLADYLAVRNTTVSAWEVGDNEPDLTTLVKIARFFKVTTDYLLGNEDEDGTKKSFSEEFEYKNIKYKRSK